MDLLGMILLAAGAVVLVTPALFLGAWWALTAIARWKSRRATRSPAQ